MSRVLLPQKIIYRHGNRYLELRAPDVSQIPDIVQAITETELRLKPFMPWAHTKQTTALQLDRMARIIGNYWRGEDFSFHGYNENGDFVCGTGLHGRVALNPKGFEIGYWVREREQSRGYATLTTKILICVAFELLKSDRVQISHNENNLASKRVIEKCGFIFEGVVRNLEGERTVEQLAGGMTASRNNVSYALLPEDVSSLSWFEDIRSCLQFVYV
jgi:RimJ/RimL family protein N-acetyltransferase